MQQSEENKGPYSLSFLAGFAKTPVESRIKLHRLPEIQLEYDDQIGILERSGSNINKSIIGRLFADNDRPFVICYNRYPYNVARGITHLIIWLNPHYDGNVEAGALEKFIQSKLRLGGGRDVKYVIFENPTQYSSVKFVRHWQLFVVGEGIDLDAVVDRCFV